MKHFIFVLLLSLQATIWSSNATAKTQVKTGLIISSVAIVAVLIDCGVIISRSDSSNPNSACGVVGFGGAGGAAGGAGSPGGIMRYFR